MNKENLSIDYSAIVILCLLGFASIFSVWVAGMPGYEELSEMRRHFGVLNMFMVSLSCFCFATVILYRHFILGSARRQWLLIFLILSSLPTALFSLVLIGRLIHGGD